MAAKKFTILLLTAVSVVLLVAVTAEMRTQDLPDLYVSEFQLTPDPPSRQKVVNVRIGVYNGGTARAGAFTVQWWPGENYRHPGCTWRVESLVPKGGVILTCGGYVFPSHYATINTKAVVDAEQSVQESDEANNEQLKKIQVVQ